MNNKNIPIVYSCSGCSSAAQMANYLAVSLDRVGAGEMSCIAGVGGNVKNLVKVALSGRKIIAIDGCSLACVKACLGNHEIVPDVHIELTKLGVPKKQHEDFDMLHANEILKKVQHVIFEPVADTYLADSRQVSATNKAEINSCKVSDIDL